MEGMVEIQLDDLLVTVDSETARKLEGNDQPC